MEHPVLSRWARVKQLRSTGPLLAANDATGNPSVAERRKRTSMLFGRRCDLLKTAADELRRRGCALVLAEAGGAVIASFGIDALSDVHRDRFREGAQWDEWAQGTNAIGTALAENTAVTVIGRAHYDRSSHGLVCYAAPIHDPAGNLLAVLDVSGPVSAADPLLGVTVQSLAASIEATLQTHAVEELEGQLRLNETFVASVGHDLRNPLTAVLNGAALILAHGDDADQRAVAERIRSSGRRMHRLVDQLSDLARARLGGGFRLSLTEDVDLAAAVERGVEEIRLAQPDRKIVVAPTGDARGRWDPVRIEQVVSNLVGNAVRHGIGEEPVRVGIDGSRRDRVFLGVTNGGQIDPAVLPHLFEPFHSSKSKAVRTPRDGLGLGLYIVEQIVRAHQGRIEVLSSRDTTTFCVALPRRA